MTTQARRVGFNYPNWSFMSVISTVAGRRSIHDVKNFAKTKLFCARSDNFRDFLLQYRYGASEMGATLNEAEQNRLIIGNMGIVPSVAADFRGRGVDFEDLLAIGRVGLTIAARTFDPTRQEDPDSTDPDEARKAFSKWASVQIRCIIQDELRSGRHHRLGDEPEPAESLRIEKIYEYDHWGNGGNARAITEQWPPSFDSSPDELATVYDDIKDRRAKFDAAFISLSPLERKVVTLVFLRDPPLRIADAAREIGISFLKTARALKRGLLKMRRVIMSMETNAQREAREAA